MKKNDKIFIKKKKTEKISLEFYSLYNFTDARVDKLEYSKALVMACFFFLLKALSVNGCALLTAINKHPKRRVNMFIKMGKKLNPCLWVKKKNSNRQSKTHKVDIALCCVYFLPSSNLSFCCWRVLVYVFFVVVFTPYFLESWKSSCVSFYRQKFMYT